MNIQAILFDLDGVLADSELLWNDIDAALLAEYGVKYAGEHKAGVLGKSFPLALQFYRDTYGLTAPIDELIERRTAIAADFYANSIPIYPSAPRVLEALSQRGLRLGLATSSVGALVLPFLERHDLRRWFGAVTTGQEVTRGKPFPDIYLVAARKADVLPAQCLVIEDALSGIAAGQAAGMKVVGIPDPRFMDVSLYPGVADYLLERLDELPGLVQELAD